MIIIDSPARRKGEVPTPLSIRKIRVHYGGDCSMGVIYKAVCNANGKMYIGQTINSLSKRKQKHLFLSRNDNLPQCSAFYSAIRKYGSQNFTFSVIEDNIQSTDELNIKESHYIKHYSTLAPNGYNLTSGGGNCKLSDETKSKMSATAKRDGRKPVIKNERPVICVSSGIEYKSINQAARENNATPSAISKAIRENQKSCGSRWIYSGDQIKPEKPHGLGRKIKCIETGIMYNSISSASKELNVSNGNLQRALKRNYAIKGTHWEYA